MSSKGREKGWWPAENKNKNVIRKKVKEKYRKSEMESGKQKERETERKS